jgi:hypothetical protein
MKEQESDIRIWEAFADEIGGEYIPRKHWNSDRTLFHHKNFKIYFDYFTYYTSGESSKSKTYTRVVIPYKSYDDFQFNIYEDELIFKIAKIFGFQDVKIGNEEFDKKYIIKTNNEQKLKNIFISNPLLKKFENFENASLLISKKYGVWEEELPENEYELSFVLNYHVKDLETLTKSKDFITEFFDRFEDLVRIEVSTHQRKI